MVYGDGYDDLPEEERIFNRFTSLIDIIGHELAHGVTQFEASLRYLDQPERCVNLILIFLELW